MCTALRYGRPNAPHSSRRLVAVELQHVDRHRIEHRPHFGGIRIDEQRDPGHERRQRIGDLARATAVSTKRGVPRQNTRPIASAPASAAASAVGDRA